MVGFQISTVIKTIKNVWSSGEHRGDNFYYAFDGQGQPMDVNAQVTFTFNDGSTQSVRFADCQDVGQEQLWT